MFVGSYTLTTILIGLFYSDICVNTWWLPYHQHQRETPGNYYCTFVVVRKNIDNWGICTLWALILKVTQVTRLVSTLFIFFLGIKQCCAKGGYQANQDLQHALSLPYDSLVELVEHLKACLEIALFRTGRIYFYFKLN